MIGALLAKRMKEADQLDPAIDLSGGEGLTPGGALTQGVVDATTLPGVDLLTAGDAGAQKNLLGLGNVDNTPDSQKPISAAVAASLASKADLIGGKLDPTQLPNLTVEALQEGVSSLGGSLLTYSGGLLSRVSYADGTHKEFTFADGMLTRVDYVTPTAVHRKEFGYYQDGNLREVTRSTI